MMKMIRVIKGKKVSRATQTESPYATHNEVVCIIGDIFRNVYPLMRGECREKLESCHSRQILLYCIEKLPIKGTVYSAIVFFLKYIPRENTQANIKIMCEELFKNKTADWSEVLTLFGLCIAIAIECADQKMNLELGVSYGNELAYHIASRIEILKDRNEGWEVMQSRYVPRRIRTGGFSRASLAFSLFWISASILNWYFGQ